MMESIPFLMIGTGIACLGQLFHMIGLGSPNWSKVDYTDIHFGLFKVCNLEHCKEYKLDALNSDYKAVQAMVIIGMLFGLGGIGVAILILINRYVNKSLPYSIQIFAPIGCAVSGVFILIGVIVYSATIQKDSKVTEEKGLLVEYGFSFPLCIVGAILMVVSGGVIFFGVRSTPNAQIE